MSAVTDEAGVLICVVGPSGAGKDALISAARARFGRDPRFFFPVRFISRAVTPDEAHIPMAQADCEAMLARGGFFLGWRAHDALYGLPAEIACRLRAGQAVVVNISRAAIPAAQAKWPRLHVVHVTVAPDVLRRRLVARGRDSAEEIEARLSRAIAVELPDGFVLHAHDNSDGLAASADRFCALIERIAGRASGQERPAAYELERPGAAGIAEQA